MQGQVDDLLAEVRQVAAKGDRVLVTTLTKRFAEDLTEYYEDLGVRVRYMHSDIDALERVRIIRDLRSGVFDVLIGINLLREGLDLPEVALVAIFDADKEGFLRSETSLIQTSGRAARHVNGRVIMYADRVTDSMRRALDEMDRRRRIQLAYNEANGVVPRSISRRMDELLEASGEPGMTPTHFGWEEADAAGVHRTRRGDAGRASRPDARGGPEARIRAGRRNPRQDSRHRAPPAGPQVLENRVMSDSALTPGSGFGGRGPLVPEVPARKTGDIHLPEQRGRRPLRRQGLAPEKQGAQLFRQKSGQRPLDTEDGGGNLRARAHRNGERGRGAHPGEQLRQESTSRATTCSCATTSISPT